VASIGDIMFRGCTALTSINIPNSVNFIGDRTFYKCTALKTIIVLNAVPPRIYPSTFEGVDKSLVHLYVPEGSINAYKAAFSWKEFGSVSAVPG